MRLAGEGTGSALVASASLAIEATTIDDGPGTEFADACSGLNSMFSLSALGLLYLYIIRRPSWLHNALMVAAILPIAFTANIVRAGLNYRF